LEIYGDVAVETTVIFPKKTVRTWAQATTPGMVRVNRSAGYELGDAWSRGGVDSEFEDFDDDSADPYADSWDDRDRVRSAAYSR